MQPYSNVIEMDSHARMNIIIQLIYYTRVVIFHGSLKVCTCCVILSTVQHRAPVDTRVQSRLVLGWTWTRCCAKFWTKREDNTEDPHLCQTGTSCRPHVPLKPSDPVWVPLMPPLAAVLDVSGSLGLCYIQTYQFTKTEVCLFVLVVQTVHTNG